jgi:hypothetical protein
MSRLPLRHRASGGEAFDFENTYAFSGTDISAFSIDWQSGLNLLLWTFVSQFDCTVEHSAPGALSARQCLGAYDVQDDTGRATGNMSS